MSDEPKQRSRAWIWALITAFVLYPLSMGPANRLAVESRDMSRNLRIHRQVYAPIWWLWQRSDTVGDAVDWYLRVWLP